MTDFDEALNLLASLEDQPGCGDCPCCMMNYSGDFTCHDVTSSGVKTTHYPKVKKHFTWCKLEAFLKKHGRL